MRYLAWFGVVFTTLLTIIYIVAFTPFGNAMIKPFAENRIKEQTKIDSRLSTFLINSDSFEILLELNQNNTLKIKGDYSLFSRSFDFAYEVAFQDLDSLSKLTNTPLRGTFFTNGTVKGDLKHTDINGMTDIGGSKSAYNMALADLEPSSFKIKMRDAQLALILDLFSKNPYATADIDLEVNLKNLKSRDMDGEITLKSKNAKLDPKYMKSDFNVTIPKTAFSMDLSAKLKGEYIDYRCDLLSNLFKITSSGKVAPEPLKADVVYALNIEDLEVLKPITGADIRGALKLDGDAKGTKESLIIKGKSDIASSDTIFEAVLKDFKLYSAKTKVENLEIEKLLYMLKQPHYGNGKLFVDAQIDDARSGNLAGKILTTIKEGVLDSAYLSKAYEFKSAMPKTLYDFQITTLLKGDMLDNKVDFNSNIAKIDMQSMKFNLKDQSINSNYILEIADLEKLFFITNQHIRGPLAAHGEISMAEDLKITLRSNIADGHVDAKLLNSDFNADIKSVKTEKILYMLTYPKFLNAALNAKVTYNLAKESGVFEGKLSNTKFEKNIVFDDVKEFAKLDMYKEFFNGDLNAKIDHENILASTDLRSINAAVKVKEAKFNTLTKQIDTDLTLKVKQEEYNVNIKGDISSPSVSIDLEKFMKTEAGKRVQEKINKSVDDLLKKLVK